MLVDPPPPPVRSGFAQVRDGAQLYWRTIGTGGPALVCCNGVGVSTFFFKYVVEHFRDRHQVLVWDYRGHGRSSMPPGDPSSADLSIERSAEDLHVVLSSAGITGPLVLLGHSMGCQVLFEYTHRYPSQVVALVPLFGTAGRPLDTFLGLPHARKAFDVLHRIAGWGGRNGARVLLPLYASPVAFAVGSAIGFVDRHYAERADIARYLEHLGHMDPQVFLRMVSLIADHDATPYLSTLEQPALVFAGERDLFTPLHLSQAIARELPQAELMILADATHAAIVEYPDTINLRIERFLREHGLHDG